MTPLYTQAEFDKAKSRDLLPLRCERCGQPFRAKKNDIQREPKNPNRHLNCYCSLKCVTRSRIHYQPSADVVCCQCGTMVKRFPNQIKKFKNHFCSHSCNAKWLNAHKTTGTRVSKLERWIQEQLCLLFPDIAFHFNQTDAIDAELDIYIPSLKLAFELNGIFHYEPIYGDKKLGRMQSNDERKMLACAELGIGLCVVDVSRMSYFKPVRAQKFLDIVVDLIRTKLSGDSPASSAVA